MASVSFPGGSVVYITDTGSSISYRLSSSSSPSDITWPFTISNLTPSADPVIIEFTTDITLSSESNQYFVCGSDKIQFGSTSLKEDGSRPIITIDGIANYPGLIMNGTLINPGKNNIHIFNLEVHTANGATLVSSGGWIAQQYFGLATSNNYILNCHSTGEIFGGSGGIVGANTGNLTVTGCSSSGLIHQVGGGIVGAYAGGTNGNIICNSCWSSGVILPFGGGIFGDYAGDDAGMATAINCYSTGIIGDNGGGIYSRYAGNSGQAVAQNCYSRGNIGTDAGGIFGSSAGSNSGITNAIICYSNGAVTTAGNGIYGTSKGIGSITTNCYIAEGSWDTTAATAMLTGTPSPPSIVGNTWIATGMNQPSELTMMGYTPYSEGAP